MKITFQYDLEKDMWCLLNKGKSSVNSPNATKVYEELVKEYGQNPNGKDTQDFIKKYLSDNSIVLRERIEVYQKDWDRISEEFQKRAEFIFNTKIPNDIIGYLTINTRCPYSIEENYFYVSLRNTSVRKTVMHELWHFYTWYAFGPDEEQRIGKEKYNDLKESLTVLLNVEYTDLMLEDGIDKGYPQHQELREKILQFWEKDKDIYKLWSYLVAN